RLLRQPLSEAATRRRAHSNRLSGQAVQLAAADASSAAPPLSSLCGFSDSTWFAEGLAAGSLAASRHASRTVFTHSIACSNFAFEADCEACRICAKIET